MFNRLQRPRTAGATVRKPTGGPAGWRPSASTVRMIVAAAIIFGVLLFLFATSAFWVNWWWYGSVGHRSVLTTRYTAEVASFLIGGAAAAAVFAANVVLALRRSRGAQLLGVRLPLGDRLLLGIVAVATLVVFLFAGAWSGSRWETWLLWLNGRDFGRTEPVFDRDVGFYLFALPALGAIHSGLFALLLVTGAAVIVTYAIRLGVRIRDIRRAPGTMRIHVLALGGSVLLLMAAGYLLANYDLVYSERGVVFGASYTDVNVQRIANWALAFVSLAAAALLLLNAWVRRLRWLLYVVGAWAVLAVVLGVLVPAAVQQTIVEPNELKRERPYIERNIELTRAAFALDEVAARELSGQQPVQEADLTANAPTLENVRLWDYRIIRTTYQQLQSFVPYYVFLDVDVERYEIDGALTQVLLAARELDPEGLPETAQTWTNRRLVYTHGYGVVVSPVDEVTRQGLPAFLVSNVPPTGSGPLAIERPEIYFGEAGADWVIVNSEETEFSGLDPLPEGAGYGGVARGSIGLDNLLTRLMVAVHLGDRNVMLSDRITDQSRVLIRRDVRERIGEIAPFLSLDPDPYLVIDGGRLFWIVDAYTATSRYPGASRLNGVNYLRNSVKVVVDAYDGTTTFYRTAVDDPLADAYGAIFDDLFRPITEVPPGIAAHFRYPEYLFDVQSEVYATFHVTDPTAFYNGEDRWTIAQEPIGGGTRRMEPYYVTMALPQEAGVDFTLIRPFIPGGRTERQNMTAWMAGRADAAGNLRLVVYRFPRQETVFGPRQIEARIDQDPEISAQITLWNQSGSNVLRGNLLVIPINNSVLYVQPLYLQAEAAAGALPELRRVIVASSERVEMAETLDQALALLTGGDGGAPTDGSPLEPESEPVDGADSEPTGGTETAAELARQALEAYGRGRAALARGDWAAYGQEQALLEALLTRLAALTGGVDAAPAGATPVAGP